MTVFERMRIVVFGSSIVSDWRNPIATSARPVLAAMVDLGHDVVFLEERHNAWRAGMLQAHGLAPLRAFDATYPELQHRTYDPPRRSQRSVAFAQQVGTADAILALPGTPDSVLEDFGAFRSRSVVRAVHLDAGAVECEVTLGPAGGKGVDAIFAPAVCLRAVSRRPRSSLAIVAYDGDAGLRASDALRDMNPALIDQSGARSMGWPYVPEVELPNWFEQHDIAVITGEWSDPLSWVRALLPLASGCRVIAVGVGAESIRVSGISAIDHVPDLAAMVREFPHKVAAASPPPEFEAYRQAMLMIDVLRHAGDEKRRARR